MVASQNGHVEVVNMLLQHGARVDLQNKVYTYNFVPLTELICTFSSLCTLHSFLHHPFIEHYQTL